MTSNLCITLFFTFRRWLLIVIVRWRFTILIVLVRTFIDFIRRWRVFILFDFSASFHLFGTWFLNSRYLRREIRPSVVAITWIFGTLIAWNLFFGCVVHDLFLFLLFWTTFVFLFFVRTCVFDIIFILMILEYGSIIILDNFLARRIHATHSLILILFVCCLEVWHFLAWGEIGLFFLQLFWKLHFRSLVTRWSIWRPFGPSTFLIRWF